MTDLRDDADRVMKKNFPNSRFYLGRPGARQPGGSSVAPPGSPGNNARRRGLSFSGAMLGGSHYPPA